MKEQEKHIELMNVECNRWKEEAHESILKYQTLEAQLEQRQDEYRSHLLAKDVINFLSIGLRLQKIVLNERSSHN